MFEFQQECGLELIKDLVKDEENLSRIYGFILYTEKDPYVAKVLRDEDFWNALNTISGSNWPIFAVRPLREKQFGAPYTRGEYQMIGFMVAMDEPKGNIPIIKDFGLENTSDLPLFVAFMWDDNDNLNEVTIPIQGNSIDTVYHSIEEIVRAIARVENAILPEYKGSVNVFRNVKMELEHIRMKHTIIERGRILKKIADFCSVFRS